MLTWLSDECGISSGDVTAVVPHSEPAGDAAGHGIPIIPFESFVERVNEQDTVIVVSDDFPGAIAPLLARGCQRIFDGDGILNRASAARRLLDAGADFHVGANWPGISDTKRDEYRRYSSEPIAARDFSAHCLFVVNSMPKSGTLWMAAMLEDILDIKARQQITISHVRDIESDWPKRNNHGALALVRDLRDIVVSWFHHLSRSDVQNGFAAPRYPDIEVFYFQYFVGQIYGDYRYYFGRLSCWLDYLGVHSIPIVRYEDMVADTWTALRKVMTFSKIVVSNDVLGEVIDRYSFDNMRDTVAGREGYIAEMLDKGHLRRGEPGAWADELPRRVADDINARFADYQHRLGYD